MLIDATRKDVIWNYLGTFLNLGINFIMLPILMFFLKSEYLALWYVFASLGSIVNMFDFGFTPVLSRNVAYCWSGVKELSRVGVTKIKNGDNSSPNYHLLSRVIRTCRILYLLIAISAATLLMSAGSLYIYSLSASLNQAECMTAWLVYVLSIFMNLYFGYYVVLLRGVGKIDSYNQALCIGKAAQIVISAVLLAAGFGLVAITAAFCVYGVLSRILFRKSFYSIADIKAHLTDLSDKSTSDDIKDTFIIVWHNAWREGLVSLAKYLTSQAGTIICSVFFTLAQTGIYSISLQITTAIASVSSVVFNAYNPSMQNAYAIRDYGRASKLLSKGMICYTLLFVALLAVFLSIGIPILELIGTDYVFDIPAIFCVGAFNYVYQRHSNFASFIANTNRIPYMTAYLVSGILGVILSCLTLSIVPNSGVFGLVVPQLVVQLVYNFWKWPSVAFKILNISYSQFILCGLKSIYSELLPSR